MYDHISPAGTLSGRRKHLELPGLSQTLQPRLVKTFMASIAIIVTPCGKAGTVRISIARPGTTANAARPAWLMRNVQGLLRV